MKLTYLKKPLLLIFGFLLVLSCSSDDSDPPQNTPDFAMTFRLNGEYYEVNNPFGDNKFSNTNIFTSYPIEDFVLLQGRNGLLGAIEIDLWLKRDQIIAGTTYQVDNDTDGAGDTTHIDLIDNSNNFFESTVSGEVNVLTVDTENKIVTGTFEFVAQDFSDPANTTINVTEGTFNYIYEE
ncbi:hypothetical protein [Winogradskyella tangerina]|uniref:hypothetical protein n=1 Tax=Winogradskyella tangerina TaxID=2023240 RepID=UPI000DBE2B78|nr:hypothetical protein [Winogradskyella tangerina]